MFDGLKSAVRGNPLIYSWVRPIYAAWRYISFSSFRKRLAAGSSRHGDYSAVVYLNKQFSRQTNKIPNLFYFDGKQGELYQLQMWFKPFADCDTDFYVCVRNRAFLKTLDNLGIKAVAIPSLSDLGWIEINGGRNIFYVNNCTRNTHMVRYKDLTHIQLLHGDSDKPPSFSPVSQMYDLLFVAGQAAIDRYYANGVYIPKEKFVISSRPQLSEFVDSCADADPMPEEVLNLVSNQPIIFFATTWKGVQVESNYSTIDSVLSSIREALEEGFSVIFRPHPLSCSDIYDRLYISEIMQLLDEYSYAENQFGLYSDSTPAGNGTGIDNYNEIANLADILVADLASTVHDWLYMEKPCFILKSDHIPDEVYENSSLNRSGVLAFWNPDNGITAFLEGMAEFHSAIRLARARTYLNGVSGGETELERFDKSLTYVSESFSKSVQFEAMLGQPPAFRP